MWSIWKQRCKVIFEGVKFDVKVTITNYRDLVQGIKENLEKRSIEISKQKITHREQLVGRHHMDHRRGNNSAERTEDNHHSQNNQDQDIITLVADGAWKEGEIWAGAGWVAMTAVGTRIAEQRRSVKAANALQANGQYGLRLALEWAANKGHKKVVCLTDSKQLEEFYNHH